MPEMNEWMNEAIIKKNIIDSFVFFIVTIWDISRVYMYVLLSRGQLIKVSKLKHVAA